MIHAKKAVETICAKIDQPNYQNATLAMVKQVQELLSLPDVACSSIDAKRYCVDVLLQKTDTKFEKDHTALIALSAALQVWSESATWADQTLRMASWSNPN